MTEDFDGYDTLAAARRAEAEDAMLHLWAGAARRQIRRYREAQESVRAVDAEDREGPAVPEERLLEVRETLVAEGQYLITAVDQLREWLDRMTGVPPRSGEGRGARIEPFWRELPRVRNALEHLEEGEVDPATLLTSPAPGAGAKSALVLVGYLQLLSHEDRLFGRVVVEEIEGILDAVEDNLL